MAATYFRDPYAHLHDEAYAQPFAAGRVCADGLITMAGRETVSLGGEWNFVLDLHDEGLRQRWFEIEDRPVQAWTVPQDYDDGSWQTTTVPSCWNTTSPERTYFEGSAWYARSFEAPALPEGQRLFLRVGAANYESRVFLNGVFVGSHRGGSTPFFLEFTAGLRPGTNRLQIQVENRRRSDRVPMNHTDWFNYGGLYREVCLLKLPKVFIADFGAAWVSGGTGKRIRFDITLSDRVTGAAQITIPELQTQIDITFQDGVGSIEADLDVQLWHPANPKLYEVEVRHGLDRIVERVGFRQVSVRGDRILLNGEDLFLRGISVHEDDLQLGKVSTEESIRKIFQHVRELNANFIRLSHYPHHERVAQIADEEGILLWSEIPVYWAIDFSNEDTFSDANNQLLEMIRRDRNRASIVIWGVGNENHDTDARLSFMSRLANSAKQADGTRLVSAACLINRESFRIEDRLSHVLDVIGINEYFGWYEPSFDGLTQLLENSNPLKPVIVTETGADALAGRHGASVERYTEENQALILQRQLRELYQATYVRGISPWVLYDFRTERRQNNLQRGINLKGLIAANKADKKLSFEAVARIYSEWETQPAARLNDPAEARPAVLAPHKLG